MGEKLTEPQSRLLSAIIETADEHKNPHGVWINGHERRSARILHDLGLITLRDPYTADPTSAGRSSPSPTQKKEGQG